MIRHFAHFTTLYVVSYLRVLVHEHTTQADTLYYRLPTWRFPHSRGSIEFVISNGVHAFHSFRKLVSIRVSVRTLPFPVCPLRTPQWRALRKVFLPRQATFRPFLEG